MPPVITHQPPPRIPVEVLHRPLSPARVTRIDGPHAVTALADAGWDELVAVAGSRDALRSVAVLEVPWMPVRRPTTSRAVLVERDGVTVAAAALSIGRERGLRTLRHLGHSSAWLAPDLPAVDGDARRRLVDALAALDGDLLVLEDLVADSMLVRALTERCPEAQIIPSCPTYVAATTMTGKSASKRRSENRRLMRRAAERGMPIEVATFAAWDDIAPQVTGLLEFQAHCRDGLTMDPLTKTVAGRALTEQAIRALGEQGRVRLVTLRVGDRPVAFHLAIVCGGHAVGFKTAAVREVAGVSGVGWCSMFAMNDLLAAEGVETIDLGFGGDAYKSHIAEPTPLVTVRLPLSRAGRAYLAITRARRELLGLPQRAKRIELAQAGAWAATLAPVVGV